MIGRVSRTSRLQSSNLLKHLGILAVAVLMIYPLAWLLSSSFKPMDVIFSDPNLFSSAGWTFSNYLDGWTALDYSFGTFFLNSFIVCAGAVIGNVISCSMAAFAFARLRFKFKALWFALMLGSIMLPYHVLVVPQYVLFKNLDWVNTFLPLIVPKFLATDAFFIFLLVQFMRALPRDLDDAAMMDGCTSWQLYWRVIMPLTVPALATTAIFTFIWTWSDFFSQLIYLNDQSLYTVPVALNSFLDSTGVSSYGQLLAMSVLSLLPIFGFFLAFQKLLIDGISTSGLKG